MKIDIRVDIKYVLYFVVIKADAPYNSYIMRIPQAIQKYYISNKKLI